MHGRSPRPMCRTALTGCRSRFCGPAERQELANPLNLIRFVPAEGLDASDTPAPQFPFNSNEGGADAHDCFLSIVCARSNRVAFAAPAAAKDKLTVYTYESFTAEWGPGPQVEEGLREPNAAARSISSRSPTAWRCSTASSWKVQSTKADIVLGLDTNLTAEAKATGLFVPHGVGRRRRQGSGRLERRHLRALRLRLFRRRLRHREAEDPAEEPEGTGRGRSRSRRSSSRIRAPRRRASACCCGSSRSMATRRRRPGPSSRAAC